MSISRRHFEAIAKAFKSNHGDDLETVRNLAENIADILATSHASFNKPLFLLACGFPPANEGDQQ